MNTCKVDMNEAKKIPAVYFDKETVVALNGGIIYDSIAGLPAFVKPTTRWLLNGNLVVRNVRYTRAPKNYIPYKDL